ncbi:Flp pilus assembly protein CpaB [Evansella tamaricis]|uniref:Flp pilus assembly protein CpaB n=1 Tax=Evansella tamaricis TaxID=2069301 RepID=A0ABS6JD38_9BACI|nr:Flp pilus assembly protein CpaB [Evansella tamaricis]MBU9711582.1 Flp pilus assembly protein CpaB [Evansella tamaricis]
MTTKKIWILAVLFGTFMSLFVYVLTASSDNSSDVTTYSELETDEIEATLIEENNKEMLEIESGKRAITIPVDEVQSVAGLITPGSYVDVISILPIPVGEETTSRILLHGVKVLAVDKTVVVEEDQQNVPYDKITLEVTPEEGVTLAFAKEAGVITLMLIGVDDEGKDQLVEVSFEDLVKGKVPK